MAPHEVDWLDEAQRQIPIHIRKLINSSAFTQDDFDDLHQDLMFK